MKKIFIFMLIVLMLFSVAVLSGCSKSDESSEADGALESEGALDAETTLEESQALESTSETEDSPTEATPTEPVGPPVDPEAFIGYWWQVEEDFSGDVDDLKDNPIYFFEVKENRMYFYTISLDENEGYGFSDKYYVLDGAYCYYDYDEINQDNYKNAMNSTYGGRFVVTFDAEDRLVLTDYFNDENKVDGYHISTFVKISATEWPIKE